MSDFIKTISFSTLIDMVLQHALKCPSEKVFMLVMDCCREQAARSSYKGVVWAVMAWLADELKWFEAVALEYYMPRHGKGPADNVQITRMKCAPLLPSLHRLL